MIEEKICDQIKFYYEENYSLETEYILYSFDLVSIEAIL
jgi:hypothetical protein